MPMNSKRSDEQKLQAQIDRLKTPQIDASSLVRLLEWRHAKDVFVSECKDGPTHTASHRRLDGWALLRTWSPITTIGYEIKVNRSDWLGDKKIADYLPLCHYLYMVAPKSLIALDELPAGIGLLEPAGTGDGRRLLTRRKAVWRDIQLPGELLVYVLMCRARITRDTNDEGKNWKRQHLERWIEEKDSRATLGYSVTAKIKSVFQDQEHRLAKLQLENQQLSAVKKRLTELGFDPDKHIDTWSINNRLKQMSGAIGDETIESLQQTEFALARTRAALEAIKHGSIS